MHMDKDRKGTEKGETVIRNALDIEKQKETEKEPRIEER